MCHNFKIHGVYQFQIDKTYFISLNKLNQGSEFKIQSNTNIQFFFKCILSFPFFSKTDDTVKLLYGRHTGLYYKFNI